MSGYRFRVPSPDWVEPAPVIRPALIAGARAVRDHHFGQTSGEERWVVEVLPIMSPTWVPMFGYSPSMCLEEAPQAVAERVVAEIMAVALWAS